MRQRQRLAGIVCQGLPHRGEVRPGFGVGWRQRDGLLEADGSIGEAASSSGHGAEVVPEGGLLGRERQRRADGRLGLGQTALLQRDHAEQMLRVWLLGRLPQHLAVARLGQIEQAGLMRGERLVEQSGSVLNGDHVSPCAFGTGQRLAVGNSRNACGPVLLTPGS